MNKIQLTMNTLFSGIGAQERGFQNSRLFDVKVLTTSDINKEAVLSYAAIHCGLTHEMVDNYEEYPSREEMAQYLTDINLGYEPEKDKPYDWFKLARRKKNDIEKYWLACKLTNNLGDISKIKELPYADLWTVSFCCQDISVAGKMKGLSPDSGTRSSLLWENIRLLKQAVENGKSPKYIMFENVKNLVSKKFINDFNNLIEVLDELGFNTYWKVINGKNCGIPQNRERVFAFAIRKDIDTGKMDFPVPFDNGVRLKDMLEESVDEKYYLSDEVVRRFITNLNTADSLCYDPCQVKREGKSREYNEFAPTLTGRDYKDPRLINEIKVIGNINSSQDGIVCSPDGIAPTHTAGHGNCPKVTVEETNTLEQVGQIYGTEKEPNPQAGRIYNSDCLSPTLDTCSGGNRMSKILQRPRGFNKGGEFEDCPSITSHSWETNNAVSDSIRIRKLTPKECWRLMGFDDVDCDNAANIGVSDSQLYKQAGNSIITSCVELLAEHLYKAQYNNDFVCFDEKFYSATDGLSSVCGDNALIFMGGIDSNKWLDDGKELSRNYKQGYRVYDSNGIGCAISTNGGGAGGCTGLYIVAMRGRYDENGKVKQHFEPRFDGITNTITTVCKDNMVLERDEKLQ